MLQWRTNKCFKLTPQRLVGNVKLWCPIQNIKPANISMIPREK